MMKDGGGSYLWVPRAEWFFAFILSWKGLWDFLTVATF